MAEYIEREALIKEISESTEPFITGSVFRAINKQPAADVIPVVHGRWVASGQCNHKPYRMRSADHWTTYKCSECGFSNGRRYNDNYCPNCGARMDGDAQ